MTSFVIGWSGARRRARASRRRHAAVARIVSLAAVLGVGACSGPPPAPPAAAEDRVAALLERGAAEAARGAWPDAIVAYRGAVAEAALEGEPPERRLAARLGLGVCRLRLAAGATPPGMTTLLPGSLDVPLLEEAAADLEAVIADCARRDAPARLEALLALGEAHELRGDRDAADDTCRQLILDAPAGAGAVLSQAQERLAWSLLARVTGDLGERLARSQIEFWLREGLDLFDRALAQRPEAAALRLGKGICQVRLGASDDGFTSLKQALVQPQLSGPQKSLAHLYSAIAIERLHGYPREALDHLHLAMESDPDWRIKELYLHLADVLPRYLAPQSRRFHEILSKLLAYPGGEPAYWSRLEALLDTLLEGDPAQGASDIPDLPFSITHLGRAVARARTGKIDAAIADLLVLRQDERFDTYSERVFPAGSSSPGLVYGRLRTLYLTGHYREVEEATRGEIPVDPISDYYYRIQGLTALNLLARWREMRSLKPDLARNPYIQEAYLLTAERNLERYLRRFPGDVEAVVADGEIRAIHGDTDAALERFCRAARIDSGHRETFERLREAHALAGAGSPEQLRAWEALRGYAGQDPTLVQYVESVQAAIDADVARHCTGCGRRAQIEDRLCVLCGRALPRARP